MKSKVWIPVFIGILGLFFLRSCGKQSVSKENVNVEEVKAHSSGLVCLPEGAKPLSAILSYLENSGYGPFIEVELEDSVWEIECFRRKEVVVLKVDVVSGEIIPNDPVDAEQSLSSLVKSLEDKGYGLFLEIESEESDEGELLWKVKTLRTSEEEFSISGNNGEIHKD